MADVQAVELARLREIGWSEWDPIGLANSDCPRDEYDSYLLQVVSRLRGGESIEQAADYLDYVASEYMGLGASTPAAHEAAGRTVRLIKDYLDNFPSGRLEVR
jgi:hypothetical protein